MMTIDFRPNGTAVCLYGEAITLQSLGKMAIRRASNVEFNEQAQKWEVRKSGKQSPLFRHESRGRCIQWEHDNWEKLI